MYTAELKQKVTKDGKEYYVFEIKLTDHYAVTAFVKDADIEIIRLVQLMQKK